MVIPTVIPPKTRKELFQRIYDIVHHGAYIMPTERYSGTGAPGIFLEDLLGLTTGNKDIPDSLGFELKFYTRKTDLVTLFHKEPQPTDVMRYMVSKYGWKDKNNRLSFRHTISGKSDRFHVDVDGDQLVVRRNGGNGVVPYWTKDDILSSGGAKLRHLILVRGSRKGNEVLYDRADWFQNLELTFFLGEVLNGTIRIDFDVREAKPDSKGLRNHGTKFRVSPGDICRLYAKKERIA